VRTRVDERELDLGRVKLLRDVLRNLRAGATAADNNDVSLGHAERDSGGRMRTSAVVVKTELEQ
jgi:hypothetical protein